MLLGAYRANAKLTAFATLGLVVATLYGLRFVQGAFQGPNSHHWKLPDLRPREWTALGLLMICLVWIGLYPQPILRVVRPALAASQQTTVPRKPGDSDDQRRHFRVLAVADYSRRPL